MLNVQLIRDQYSRKYDWISFVWNNCVKSKIILSNPAFLLLDLHMVCDIFLSASSYNLYIANIDYRNFYLYFENCKDREVLLRDKILTAIFKIPFELYIHLSSNVKGRSLPNVIHLFYSWRCLWNLTFLIGSMLPSKISYVRPKYHNSYWGLQ